MSCYGPLTGYFSKTVNPATGRRGLVFDVRKSYDGLRVSVPCGECVGCLLEKRRQWAVRCDHEKRMYEGSSFITLTYNDVMLPRGGTLVLGDLQRFFKRLRKVRPEGVRYFACGEYGETTYRPHYHVLLLNTYFGDQVFYKKSRAGYDLFRSAELAQLWCDNGLLIGDHYIGNVTPESAGYCVGYCLKKFGSKFPDGFFGTRAPEFRVMSRKPGLGYPWFERYHSEAYAHDSAISNSREVRLPRYYDEKFKALDGDRYAELKMLREAKSFDSQDDRSSSRLRVREQVALSGVTRFKRDLT